MGHQLDKFVPGPGLTPFRLHAHEFIPLSGAGQLCPVYYRWNASCEAVFKEKKESITVKNNNACPDLSMVILKRKSLLFEVHR